MTDQSHRLSWTNERRKLGDLVEWPKNPRQIDKHQARRLRQSLSEFGQVLPICIDPENMIIDGHQRKGVWGMADEFGPEFMVDVRVASRKLSDDEQQKLTVFLEKAKGDWDFDTLASYFEVDDLLDWGFDEGELDLELWGLPEVPEDPGAQVDRAEELREKWGAETGQLWQLGEHRLICGDCTDADVVERVMGGEELDLVVTDPPYSVDYAAKNRALQTIGPSNRLTTDIEGDMLGTEETAELIWQPAFKNAYNCSRNGTVIYCFAPQGGDQMMMMMMMKAEWNKRLHQIIWRKNAPTFSMGRLDYQYQHEPILYTWKGTNHSFYGSGARSVIDCDRPHQSKLHPTMKPIELIEKLIVNSSQKDDTVYDPFLGSGTTLIACERLGRRCRAVEISPAYCAVALQRWADMTGETPVLLDN